MVFLCHQFIIKLVNNIRIVELDFCLFFIHPLEMYTMWTYTSFKITYPKVCQASSAWELLNVSYASWDHEPIWNKSEMNVQFIIYSLFTIIFYYFIKKKKKNK